tara:strand:- start:262 stop:504 length:243 start_codon:yes stop_codon:yes gene_type:complete
MYFINNNPTDIQAVLNLITQKRLHRAIENKGFPPPTDTNKFILIVKNQKGYLYYKYGSKPTMILELLPVELPKGDWGLFN